VERPGNGGGVDAAASTLDGRGRILGVEVRMIMGVEDEYTDVLQNIEFSIVSVHRDDPRLLDLDVIEAIEALIRGYSLEEQGRAWPSTRLSSRAALVVEACKPVCEWRLGRTSISNSRGADGSAPAISVATIVQCLKRLRKSARMWNEHGGRQGYLEYIEQFMP
jgi:hypothetical protein